MLCQNLEAPKAALWLVEFFKLGVRLILHCFVQIGSSATWQNFLKDLDFAVLLMSTNDNLLYFQKSVKSTQNALGSELLKILHDVSFPLTY